MIYLVQEDARCPIFTRELVGKTFPYSSVIRVDKRMDVKISGKPSLTKTWLLLLNNNLNAEQLEKYLATPNCSFVVYVDDKNLNYKASICKKFDTIKILNVTNFCKEDCIDYIMKRLSISETLAKEVFVKTGSFLPRIEEAIVTLSCLNNVGSKEIDSYLPRSSSVSVNTVFYYIIGLRKTSESKIVDFLWQFRYSFSYLKKNLIRLCNACIRIYGSLEEGELGLDNVDEYLKKSKLDVSPYFIRLIISEVYRTLTFSEIYVLRLKLNKSKTMLDLLNLIGGD